MNPSLSGIATALAVSARIEGRLPMFAPPTPWNLVGPRCLLPLNTAEDGAVEAELLAWRTRRVNRLGLVWPSS